MPEGGTVSPLVRRLCPAAWLVIAASGLAAAQPVDPVLSLAKKERPALLATLEELVSIETGSRDLDGLDRAAELIAARLRALGGKVELVDPTVDAYRMAATPARIGKIVHAISVHGRVDQLDLAAQRPQAGCDQLGGAIQTLEVAAAGLDRHQLLQRGQERGPLFLREREHRIHRLRGGETRRGDHKPSGGAETSNERAHGASFGHAGRGILSGARRRRAPGSGYHAAGSSSK